MTLLETKNLAERLALEMPGRVYAFVGDLGAGKTTFSQFFLRALGVMGTITSPTFVVMKPYQLNPPFRGKYTTAYHLDCYRLKDTHDLGVLDFKKILHNPANVILIEWADRITDALPPDAVWLDFSHGASDGERSIRVRRAIV